MLVLGDREQESGKLAVRSHDGGDLGEMTPAELAERIERGADDGCGARGGASILTPNAGHPHHDAPLSAPVPAFPIHFPSSA